MRAKLGGLAVAAVVLIVLPFALSGSHTVELATVGAYFIAIVGLDVLTRHTGQVSLGHGAFMAIGGYTTAILMASHGVRDLWTIPAAGAAAGVVGVLAGIPALRLSGLSFALASFGIAVSFPAIPKKLDHFAGGSTGIALLGRPEQTGHGLGVWRMTNAEWVYALTWTVAIACLLVAWALLASRFGRSLRAVRDNELVAVTSGINRPAHKLAAFGISAAFAGVAGSLLAINVGHVSPGAIPIQLSLYLLAGAAVGFLGSIWGAVLGALVVQFLPSIAGVIPHVDTKRGGPTTFFFGAVLVVLMLLVPATMRAARMLARRGSP